MSLFCSLNGFPVVQADVFIPYFGAWTSDVMLTNANDVSGTCALVLGDLSLVGTVFRGSVYQGQASYRIVGGYGGWRKDVKAKSYTHELGVRASTVAGDAAKEVGEKLVLATDFQVGGFFVRQQEPASRVLAQLGLRWWIDVDGTTKTAPRATGEILKGVDVIGVAAHQGVATLATETPGVLMPGKTIDVKLPAHITIANVHHRIEKGSFRSEAYAL